jgi:uncharacterized membrane protein (DUF2068 family)
MDWSLLACGARGHVTYAPEEPALRSRLSVPGPAGETWRCLRCGTFVPGKPTAGGPAAGVQEVRRDRELRSALILRVFAVERFARAIIFGLVAFALAQFADSRGSLEQAFDRELPALRTALREFGYNVDRSKVLGLIHHAFSLGPHTLTLLILAAAGYAAVEVIEGVGLWLLKRWGEYFAMIATSLGVPYEVYELTAKVTVIRLLALLINLALVVYLVLSKRLFGARGGKPAYEAKLRSESVMQGEIDAVAAAEAAAAGKAGDGAAAGDGKAGQQPAPSRQET